MIYFEILDACSYACMIKEPSYILGIKIIESECFDFPVLAYWIDVFKTIGFDIL